MKKALLYLPGKGGSAAEAETYRALFDGYTIASVDYEDDLPWLVEAPIRHAYDALARDGASVTLLANSIGAYFGMHALQDRTIAQALFISPILDMERLILDMMGWANVTEAALADAGEIATDFGETLSWDYLQYVRAHPIQWHVPTQILYAERDHLTARATVDAFIASHNAQLSIMPDGEHWFHTDAQIAFLHRWLGQVCG